MDLQEFNDKEEDPVIRALEYAIYEADGWHDDCRGGPIETEEMDKARQVLKRLKESKR